MSEPEGVVLHDNATGKLITLDRMECIVKMPEGHARIAVLRMARGVLLAPKEERD